jgi:hypothetical protein
MACLQSCLISAVDLTLLLCAVATPAALEVAGLGAMGVGLDGVFLGLLAITDFLI